MINNVRTVNAKGQAKSSTIPTDLGKAMLLSFHVS